MKFGLWGFHLSEDGDPTSLRELALTAEEGGFESLWVGDHLALPSHAPAAGRPRTEAVATLAFLAGVTDRVRLGTGVIVLPQRNPLVLAQQLSTVDRLSQGRLTVGLGVGYVKSELTALGVALNERGRRADEYLRVMRLLWAGQPASFEGEFVRYDQLVQRPVPHQSPSPPIVMGGHAPASLERAARSGDGWFGWSLDRPTIERSIKGLAGLRSTAGGSFEVTVVPTEPITADAIDALGVAGVDRIVITPGNPEARMTDGSLSAGFVSRAVDTIAPFVS